MSHGALPYKAKLNTKPKIVSTLKDTENTCCTPRISSLASFSAIIIEMATGMPAAEMLTIIW